MPLPVSAQIGYSGGFWHTAQSVISDDLLTGLVTGGTRGAGLTLYLDFFARTLVIDFVLLQIGSDPRFTSTVINDTQIRVSGGGTVFYAGSFLEQTNRPYSFPLDTNTYSALEAYTGALTFELIEAEPVDIAIGSIANSAPGLALNVQVEDDPPDPINVTVGEILNQRPTANFFAVPITAQPLDISGGAVAGGASTIAAAATVINKIVPVSGGAVAGGASTIAAAATVINKIVPVSGGAVSSGAATVALGLSIEDENRVIAVVVSAGPATVSIGLNIVDETLARKADIFPEPTPIFPHINIAERVDLLIPQYSEANRLLRLASNLNDIVEDRVIGFLRVIERAINPDESEGILLDWIGQRLGLPRPNVAGEDNVRLGFEGTFVEGGRSLSQAPFFDRTADIDSLEPIGDEIYRLLLKGRARRLRGGANRETIEAVLTIIFGNGYLDESGTPLECVVTADSDLIYGLVNGRLFETLIPRPAGRAMRMRRNT